MKAQQTWAQAHQRTTVALINDLDALFAHWRNVKSVGYGLHRAQGEKLPKRLKSRYTENRLYKFIA